MKLGGGVAGHNGLRDIPRSSARRDFWRLRLGIGHPRDSRFRSRMSSTTCCSRRARDERDAIDDAIDARARRVAARIARRRHRARDA